MRVLNIDPESPLYGEISPGYVLKTVNNHEIQDSLDFYYHATGEKVRLKFINPKGETEQFLFEDIEAGELGLELDDGKIKTCRNRCIFCFVHQQPPGLRRQLYVKDEDYRLSFTHGNYITLSNTTEADLKRIVKQRLSPLYISVHTTDHDLRCRMLGNRKLGQFIPQLKYLTKNGIIIHTQVVLCPGINDGPQLEKTINDLAGFYPNAASLAIVPVGLTRYRERLPKLRQYSQEEAVGIIDYIESRQKDFLKQLGSRFVWPADEFYIKAKRSLPPSKVYELMEQFENGVGMAREFITRFNRRRQALKVLNSSKKMLFLTGSSAYPFIMKEILPFLRDTLGLEISLKEVPNRFWGDSVTVSGLITGKDMLAVALAESKKYDVLVLPPNCLNNDNLFLDDMSLETFKSKVKKSVVVGSYDIVETIKRALA